MDSINRIGTANRDYTKVRFPLDTYLTIWYFITQGIFPLEHSGEETISTVFSLTPSIIS